MAKRFLSLEEAAEQLGMTTTEVARLREAGDLRGFADRGAWKFRKEDVESAAAKLAGGKNEPSDFEAPAAADPEEPATDLQQLYAELDTPEMDEDAGSAALPQQTAAADDEPLFVDDTDSDPALVMDEGDSGLTLDSRSAESGSEDEGIAMESGDSGLTLDSGDSGLTLDSGDSGLTLDSGDSGLTLDSGDSGLTLDAADSGLTLDPADEPAVAAAPADTQRMEDLSAESGEIFLKDDDEPSGGTQKVHVPHFDDEEDEFELTDQGDMSEDDIASALGGAAAGSAAATEQFDFDEDSSGAVTVDQFDETGDEIEELDEIFDADDEVFEDDFSSSQSMSEFSAASLPSTRPSARRLPGWGGAVYAALLIAAPLAILNVWLIFEAVSTMWGVGSVSDPAMSVIDMLANLI